VLRVAGFRVAAHPLRLPVSWFEKHHIGDIMSRFGSLVPVEGNVAKDAAALGFYDGEAE
jgi:ATP-binding cassette subfamily B protein RaxB